MAKRSRPRTRLEKRSASSTWRRPRNMPLAVWEEANESMDRYMIEWARGLLIEDDDGRVRKLTEEEVLAVTKAGQWAGSNRAKRRKKRPEP